MWNFLMLDLVEHKAPNGPFNTHFTHNKMRIITRNQFSGFVFIAATRKLYPVNC